MSGVPRHNRLTAGEGIVGFPVVAYLVLAMVLGGGTVALVARGTLPAGLALVSALSASVAGIIMTAVEDGKRGLTQMLRRLLIWRVGIGYWAFALLFVVPAILVGSLANPLFHGDGLLLSRARPAFPFLLMAIVFFIVAGLGQELGWTGFLMPRLQSRYSALASCAIRALLAGLWHLPLLLYSRSRLAALADLPYGGWIAEKGFPVTVGALLGFLLIWSIFHGWLFNNTGGSLLLVSILHGGSETWVAYIMLRAGIAPDNLDNYWGYGLVMAAVALMIVITTGARHLSRRSTRIVYRPSAG